MAGSQEISELPVAVIGAGPVGLAAAAQLASRGELFVVLEKGASAGHAVRNWQHVELFSPWRYCIDDAASALLQSAGWTAPDMEALPTGRELVEAYLEPLAGHAQIRPFVRYESSVERITRQGYDKVRSDGREAQPFELRLTGGRSVLARAVIDASGTWFTPSPIGANGLPVAHEQPGTSAVAYGIPDVMGRQRGDYAGRRVLVVGSGHSAINTVVSLLALKEAAPSTTILWAMRRRNLARVYGGGEGDGLPARGALGVRARDAIESGAVELLAPFAVEELHETARGLSVRGLRDGEDLTIDVDRVVVATGFRPDLSISGELRLDLDPLLEASRTLGPLIDPNVHSCGTVPPHSYVQLAHPERDFFTVGMKSYGRAPTFLMATGYEQVRSVVAHLCGDEVAAREARLVLPETGVCGGRPGEDSCCGGPASSTADACCVLDEQAKASGLDGCGCGTTEHTAGAVLVSFRDF